MSTETNPANSQSTISETAKVRLVSQRRWVKSDYKLAHVLVSSRIYWKAANSDESDKPQSLIEFRNVNSLRLTRLSVGEWNDVNFKNKVKQVADGEKICISVPGFLHGPKRLLSFFFLRKVVLEIDAGPSAHDELLNQIRALIIPWRLFPELAQSLSGPEPSTMRTGAVRGSDNSATNLDPMLQKLTVLDDLITKGAAGINAGGTLVRLMTDEQCEECLRCVAEVAERVANISTITGGFSAVVFYLVKFTAQTVLMCLEAERGRKLLPATLDQLVVLLRFVVEDIIEISNLSQSVREIDKDFVFKVLELLVCTMDTAETQLLRGSVSQIVKSNDVKVVEKNMHELLGEVVFVGYMAKTNRIAEELEHVREDLDYTREEQRQDRDELDYARQEQRRDREELEHARDEQRRDREELEQVREEQRQDREELEQVREEQRQDREELEQVREEQRQDREELEQVREEQRQDREELEQVREEQRQDREELEQVREEQRQDRAFFRRKLEVQTRCFEELQNAVVRIVPDLSIILTQHSAVVVSEI